MKRFWTGLVLLGLTWAVPAEQAAEQRKPVLLELFTSEGCSSCPPADALLERLDRSQPVPGAEIIALSEHVDYWNHIGWADPYSSAAFSARQQQYARKFRTEGPYTPQMVVDGQSEFVGSDAQAAESAVRSAITRPKVAIQIVEAEGTAAIEVSPLPTGTARKAGVFAAFASDAGTQDVLRGENKGRRLHHVAILKELKQIGAIDAKAGCKATLRTQAGARLVVFVQEAGNGPVWGAAMHPARN